MYKNPYKDIQGKTVIFRGFPNDNGKKIKTKSFVIASEKGLTVKPYNMKSFLERMAKHWGVSMQEISKLFVAPHDFCMCINMSVMQGWTKAEKKEQLQKAVDIIRGVGEGKVIDISDIQTSKSEKGSSTPACSFA